MYDLEAGQPFNVEFESNPPTSVRRASLRYLNSLDSNKASLDKDSSIFQNKNLIIKIQFFIRFGLIKF